ncbi:D-alanyl-D-alanine carboxypeptidase (penicillin-binding protein 5/6) [Anaerospora hongkongensis]|uniref:D-alanyl-D-alanine carboxypeptidase (Penicillin-binding protein 5/6) n=1 Tax=Anaerospora hongkongensis TaxID=244830 RepID=A0A4R1Q4J0_9FIRM|nr:D-alanyl-D-alanine carboxypeptidase family protein [Anaerospora hongkongensis]TCL35695.1 D-alanyl-D-alanine carboxypeptidase (penicillin-binding protein 5/6) [Anaerospora hongkongensis]
MYQRFFAGLLFCFLYTNSAFAAVPQVEAEAAVVMSVTGKQVLFAKQADAIMYPASTTKIVTLITALEKGNLNSTVVVSPQAAACDGSSLELRAGDKLKLEEALYGMMLVSGNDAAEAIAESVAGSIPDFVKLMNAKAGQIGATRTNFSNPHGLPDPYNHYTTAYDLALITAYGMQNPTFARIVSTRDYDVHFLNRQSTHAKNTNKLLATFIGANGVKTGYTEAAGDCLVAAANRNGVELIAVILNSDGRWEDAAKLLNYGFQQLGL